MTGSSTTAISSPRADMARKKKGRLGTGTLLAAAFAAAFLVSTFLFAPVRIVGSSMAPTLEKNDWVILSRRAYDKAGPQRGDILLFRKPEVTKEILVKRVIGLPGDTVEIRDGMVYINGRLLAEYSAALPGDTMAPVTAPPGAYFVLGDNRGVSQDSRRWADPWVEEGDILGRVTAVIFPNITNFTE